MPSIKHACSHSNGTPVLATVPGSPCGSHSDGTPTGFAVREQIRKPSTGQNTGQRATSDTMLTSQMTGKVDFRRL